MLMFQEIDFISPPNLVSKRQLWATTHFVLEANQFKHKCSDKDPFYYYTDAALQTFVEEEALKIAIVHSTELYDVAANNNLTGYTSRGCGVSGVPLRFNCKPEITLFTLRSVGSNSV